MAIATPQLFPWKDSYKVNIELIDLQHKGLVSLINELHEAMMQRTAKDRLGGILANLVQYTKNHFKTEETILQSSQYPDFANHKAEHDRFAQTIMDYQAKFQKSELGLTVEVMGFLKDWLLKHIMGVDKRYVPHLSAKGAR